MQELSSFYGITVKVDGTGTDRLGKPHVYVYFEDKEASVALNGEVLKGELPLKQYRVISAWLILHNEELQKAWKCASKGKPVSKIRPLI